MPVGWNSCKNLCKSPFLKWWISYIFFFSFLTKKIIVLKKLWEFRERLDKRVKTILDKIAEKFKGKGTVMHIWQSESYSDLKHIFFIQKKNITGVLHIFYQISYFYALFKTNYMKVQIQHFAGPQRVLVFKTEVKVKKKTDCGKVVSDYWQRG